MTNSHSQHPFHDAHVGGEVTIEEGVVIGVGALITGRVTLRSGTVIGPGTTIEGPSRGEPITIGPRAVVGAGCTVSICDVRDDAHLMAGSVAVELVPKGAVVQGNPARIIRYRISAAVGDDSQQGMDPTALGRGSLQRLTFVQDMRGALVAGEFPADLPFIPARFFIVRDVPGPEVRGEHAHFECEQFLVAVSGSLEVICNSGGVSKRYLLDRPDLGLYLPAMTWGVQHRFSAGAVLLVLASAAYDDADYIRDFDEFETLQREK